MADLRDPSSVIKQARYNTFFDRNSHKNNFKVKKYIFYCSQIDYRARFSRVLSEDVEYSPKS